MSVFEWILFLWMAMGLIKWVIILATVIETSIKYDESKSNIPTVIVDLMAGSIVSSLVVLFLWPKYLYKEKFAYFVYPDKKIQHFLIKFFVIRKKNAEIKASRK